MIRKILLMAGLLLISLVIQGCGKGPKPSTIFEFVRGDSAITTRHFEAMGLGPADTVTIFQTDGTDLVIVEFCDGERTTLHEKWLNPLGYERKDCEVLP